MFLILVISRLSIVRITSADVKDRQRRVVEVRRAVHDHEVVVREALETFLTPPA